MSAPFGPLLTLIPPTAQTGRWEVHWGKVALFAVDALRIQGASALPLRESDAFDDDANPDDDALYWDLLHIERRLMLDPVTCYQVVASCIAGGYDMARDGANLAYWMLRQIQHVAHATSLAET